MALEAMALQQKEVFCHKELYNLLEGMSWNSFEDDYSCLLNLDQKEDKRTNSLNFLENQTENDNFLHYQNINDKNNNYPSPQSSLPPYCNDSIEMLSGIHPTQLENIGDENNIIGENMINGSNSNGRSKRRRPRSRKNKEEIENQRITHITVERNRRKQMNDYLSVLRSLMPESYVQRGDQASIIGGAINFVKELEQKLQLLGSITQNQVNKTISDDDNNNNNSVSPLPFSEFFTFPQYSSTNIVSASSSSSSGGEEFTYMIMDEAENFSSENRLVTIADVEVTMTESHVNLKIRSKRRPKQLLKVVSGLHSLFLTVLHLNVTTFEQIVLYSFSLKVEDNCQLTSVDEIATAVYQMLCRINEEETNSVLN